MTKSKYWLIWFFFLLLGLVVCWPLLTSSDLNLKYDWGFALYDWTKTWHDATTAWNDFFLGQAVGINAAWLPLLLISGFGLVTALPVLLTLKLIVLGTIVVGGVGMTWLLKNRGLALFPALIGGIIYVVSPLIFIRVVVGFIFYLIAIALSPWLVRAWFITVEQRRTVWWGFFMPVLFVLISAQPQFAVMILVILLLDLIAAPNINYFKRGFGLVVFMIASAAIVQLPWLSVVLRDGIAAAANINNLGSSYATITSLPHSLIRTLIGADHHITYQFFDQLLKSKWFISGSFGVVLLAIMAPALASRRREVRLFSLILALAWLLALGPAEPTGNIFHFIYDKLPFTNLFREVYHWSFLITFSLAALAAVTLNHWWSKTKRRSLPVAACILLIIGLAAPYWQGGWSHFIGAASIPDSYRLLVATAENELNRTTRSLFLPPLGFIKFKDDQSPGATNADIYALSTNRSQIPAEASVLDLPSPSVSFRSALVMSLYAKDPYVAGLMQAVAANNIFNRVDLESEFPDLFAIPRDQPWLAARWYNVNYTQLLSYQPQIVSVTTQPGVERFAVANTPPLIGLADHPVTAAYDWRTLARANGDAVFYLEDISPADRVKVESLPYIGDPADRLAATNQAANVLPRLSYAPAASVTNGWVRPSGSWWVASSLAYTKESYLFTQNGASAGPVTVALSARPTESQLYLKIWSGLTAETVTVKYGQFEQVISTKSDNPDGEWVWQKLTLPPANNDAVLTIEGGGATGLAQVLVLADEPAAPVAKTTIDEPAPPVTDYLVFTKKSASDFSIKANVATPRWLIFRMGYDRDWVLANGRTRQRPLPVNGLGMAWQLPAGTTEADIVFKPQFRYTGWQLVALGYLLTLSYFAWRARHQTMV